MIKKNIAVSDTGFVFDPGTGDSYSLNSIGLEIVKLMKEGTTPEAIQKILLEKYDIDCSTLEMHFHDFLGMLKHYQIFETHE